MKKPTLKDLATVKKEIRAAEKEFRKLSDDFLHHGGAWAPTEIAYERLTKLNEKYINMLFVRGNY